MTSPLIPTTVTRPLKADDDLAADAEAVVQEVLQRRERDGCPLNWFRLAASAKREMDDLGLFASILGHIGDGNFHESIMYNRGDPVERAKVEGCVKNMVNRALEMEGTCTGKSTCFFDLNINSHWMESLTDWRCYR